MSESNPNSRLEAFCDGVFAIAMTLLIIDIKIPSTKEINNTAEFWRALKDPAPGGAKKGLTQWNPFKENTKYFEPSTKDFMINYRVENLEAMVEELRKENVTIVDKIETYDYGKFVHILDIEGNKIELWEAKD